MKSLVETRLFCFLFLIFLFGCSLNQQQDFQLQGKAHLKSLTKELQNIHDIETLMKKEKKLKTIFDRIANDMIAYHQFLEKHPDLRSFPTDDLVMTAADLKSELERIYQIDGAKEIIIKAEKDAFLKMTLMEETLQKRPWKK